MLRGDVVLVTGSCGLVGSEACKFFARQGLKVVGVDNNLRSYFFGEGASTVWMKTHLRREIPDYEHHDCDIRNNEAVSQIFEKYGQSIDCVIHTAAQPSHDWAAKEPFVDFGVNAMGTLVMLENTRIHSPDATFIFTSTNKVYGDAPNRLPLVELDTRWEIEDGHPYWEGIDENFSIDQSKHSIFGASKVAADMMVQEYGRYFGMRTGVFRAGCISGPNHAGAQLHGFLSYLLKCAVIGTRYTIFGYKGKQVRDNIHSWDLVNAFWHFSRSPRCGEAYNIGGSRFSNCSVMEAIAKCEAVVGRKLDVEYRETNRIGDHIWWISDVRKFRSHYPAWELRYGIDHILRQIHDSNRERWSVLE